MTSFEKKIIEFVEKHFLLFLFLFVSGVSFLIRRQLIWYRAEDFSVFYDFHEKTIQTAGWFVNFKWFSKIGDVSINSSKWLILLSDYLVAVLATVICMWQEVFSGNAFIKKNAGEKKFGNASVICGFRMLSEKKKAKLLLLYTAFLFAPTVILRGMAQGREDSFGMAFLLGGYLLYLIAYQWMKKNQSEGKRAKGILMLVLALLFAGYGICICPWNIFMVIVWASLRPEDNDGEVRRLSLVAVMLIAVGLQLIFGRMMELTLGESFVQLLRFLRNDAATGEQLLDAGPWMWQQLLIAAYPVTIVGGILLGRKNAENRWRNRMLFLALVIALATCLGVSMGISVFLPY